jgi:hypothetical protein
VKLKDKASDFVNKSTQKRCINKEEAASLTASAEVIMITFAIKAT